MTVAAVPSTATRPARPARRQLPGALSTVLAIAGVFAVWEVLARTMFAGSFVLAPPSSIVERIGNERALYQRNLAHTTVNAAWGFFWGNLVAVALACVATLVPGLRRVVSGVSLTIFCLPLVALAPILRVVLGPGETTPIVLAALAVFFTTFIAAMLGFDSAPAGALEMVRSYGRGRTMAFVMVRLRASVPAMFAGFQIAAPAAFLGALVGEFTGSSRGLGILTVQALRTLETERVWTVAMVSTVVAVGAYLLVGWVGRMLCPWAPTIDVTAVTSVSRRGGRGRRVTAFLAPFAAVVVLWIGFLRVFDVNPFFAKTPVDVWSALVTGPRAAETRSLVLPALADTVGVTVLGFLAGLIAAMALAVGFVLVPFVERSLLPVAVALRAVPIITTTPVIILALGRGLVATVAIVAVMSFFPTLVNCHAAMRRTPDGILDVLRSYDAGAVARATVAHLPTAVPALLASARIAVPTSLLGATVAEWLATGRGIGNVMIVAANTARYDTLWVCVALLTIVAVLGYWAVSVLERAVLARMSPERAP